MDLSQKFNQQKTKPIKAVIFATCKTLVKGCSFKAALSVLTIPLSGYVGARGYNSCGPFS